MKLEFDHCFTPDQNHRFLRRLKRFGFEENAGVTRHPGGDTCRFLMFRSMDGKGRSYLEFVHSAARKVVHPYPGLSFRSDMGLEKFARVNARRLNGRLIHRNYDWYNEPRRQRRAGWNFLFFKSRGFRSLFPWITEYEWTEERSRRPHPPAANNGVIGIVGLDLELNAAGVHFFERLFGRRARFGLRLKCGTQLWFRRGRRTKLRHVVLGTKSVKNWARKTGVKDIVEFEGRPAARIANPTPGMWDVLIV